MPVAQRGDGNNSRFQSSSTLFHIDRFAKRDEGLLNAAFLRLAGFPQIDWGASEVGQPDGSCDARPMTGSGVTHLVSTGEWRITHC